MPKKHATSKSKYNGKTKASGKNDFNDN